MNAHDAAAAAMCAAADVEIQAPTGELRGREAVELLAQTFMTALGIVPVGLAIPRASAVGARRWGPADDADQTASEDIASRLHDALNAHDLDAVCDLAADDLEVIAPTIDTTGRDAFRELV